MLSLTLRVSLVYIVLQLLGFHIPILSLALGNSGYPSEGYAHLQSHRVSVRSRLYASPPQSDSHYCPSLDQYRRNVYIKRTAYGRWFFFVRAHPAAGGSFVFGKTFCFTRRFRRTINSIFTQKCLCYKQVYCKEGRLVTT